MKKAEITICTQDSSVGSTNGENEIK